MTFLFKKENQNNMGAVTCKCKEALQAKRSNLCGPIYLIGILGAAFLLCHMFHAQSRKQFKKVTTKN